MQNFKLIFMINDTAFISFKKILKELLICNNLIKRKELTFHCPGFPLYDV